MKRVVGYYEGWAARRPCQAFMPEDVPLGVYTHLNFAFAGIDPHSYEIVPAQAEDIALYSRLTALKKLDSALKVYIAIGGWTFNDPGPTYRTFSELAADESKQRVFFKSLIRFMNTYNFDGVDIDWEYPVDKDRGGTVADFANFPKFLRNLKAALDSGSGGRNGISITLPVSFWYLQNFDIAELQKWVDFFNIMSYDLHGLWDKGNKWLGAYLNSHTNMTEITEYLDLFWRNDIKPEKVTLGLAFYSRTFLVADKGCTKAKCMFDSVGEAGPCSKDDVGGTLTNAELTDQIRAAGVTPTLDKEAMVKVAVVGRKWITYDDEDTFKLKADIARKMCLGGVMVWAVSQDYTDKTAKVAAAVGKRASSGLFDTRYSAQLQSATRYKSMKAVTVKYDKEQIDEPTPNIIRNQCFWSNCGAGCGSGYKLVPRLDKDGRKGESMQDGHQCQGGTLRQFCCPSSKTIPKCGWFDFFNGSCGKRGGCPAGSEEVVAPSDQQREVGSTKAAYHNGKAQVACCQTKTESGKALDSMMGYDMCKWYGVTNNKCDFWGAIPDDIDNPTTDLACTLNDSERPETLLMSHWGSAATYCRNPKYKGDQVRPLCCKESTDNMMWDWCTTEYSDPKDGNFCQASCPAGSIRLAMEQPPKEQGCKGGGNALCCDPRFLTEANNSDEVHHGYVLALERVLKSPEKCDWAGVNKLDKRALSEWKTDCQVALKGTMNMLGSPDIGVQQKYMNDFNLGASNAGLYGISASYMQTIPEGYAFSTAPSGPMQTEIAEGLLNAAQDIDAKKKQVKQHTWNCPAEWVWDTSRDGLIDPDDGGEEVIEPDYFGTNVHRRRRDFLDPNLQPRNVEDDSDVGSEIPSDNTSDTSSDTDSITDLKPEDWHEGLARLRHFYLKDDGKDRVVYNQGKAGVQTSDDGHGCKDNSCRARTPGSDLPKPADPLSSVNRTGTGAEKGHRRYEDVLEMRNQWKNGTLDKRQLLQFGASRGYKVMSAKYSRTEWPGEVIESWIYPNGNQGDDLRQLNADMSRYQIKSEGCGPQEYELQTQAPKAKTRGIWVSEHILELNTIGRFMTAMLDGGLGGVGDPGDANYLRPYEFQGLQAGRHQVEMFAYRFSEWDKHTAISPADTCLLKLGSIREPVGLVVCDSNLNQLKTLVYKLMNPVGEIRWLACCTATLPKNLENALATIQGIMGVFDYYDDPNVKTRHAQAYRLVLAEMGYFEEAYGYQFNTDITGLWQQRWYEFMNAHFLRVGTHSRTWVLKKLNALRVSWTTLLLTCPLYGAEVCEYSIVAVQLINSHYNAVDQGQKIVFDHSIFRSQLGNF
jgi:GH18 family chitinase